MLLPTLSAACLLAPHCPPRALCTMNGVQPLPESMTGKLPALRGPVAEGFGRGSKKLGIPTANLPCSLFQEQLADLPCGVYIGWASVRGGVHPSVCNIGFSPTFEGAENPEKIVDAHVMSEFESDFYGESMGPLLLAFIRDERKFGSLDELVSTIKADIATASAALKEEPLSYCSYVPWLREAGSGEASFELLDAMETLYQAKTIEEQLSEQPSAPPSTGSAAWEAAPPAGFEWGASF